MELVTKTFSGIHFQFESFKWEKLFLKNFPLNWVSVKHNSSGSVENQSADHLWNEKNLLPGYQARWYFQVTLTSTISPFFNFMNLNDAICLTFPVTLHYVTFWKREHNITILLSFINL